MDKILDVINNLYTILCNDQNQFEQIFASRDEIFELAKKDLEIKRFLADKYKQYQDEYDAIVKSAYEGMEYSEFVCVFKKLCDLIISASEEQDFYSTVVPEERIWDLVYGFPRTSNRIIDLEFEYDRFMGMLLKGENFTLTRSGDGERAIAQGRYIKAQEGWVSPNELTRLGKDILESYKLTGQNVYHGISCPCCDVSAYLWYLSYVEDVSKTTFANLWVNSNYRRFTKDFELLTRDAVVIANYHANGKKIGNLNVLEYYSVSDDCVSFWENEAEEMLNRVKSEYGGRDNLLYVISCGPMSNPIIAELYKNNPNNTYVDFGSSIDGYIYDNIQTRAYMNPASVYAQKRCWMPNPKNVKRPGITAVMTLYKRPGKLVEQLEAIENQTIPPEKIILFQDRIENGVYHIELEDEIKKRFDNVRVCTHNEGVWGRFDFAYQEADTNYVCLFDDDTIPGSRWFENCFMHMLQKEGIYVTIGVELGRKTDYPYLGQWYRLGWSVANRESIEVDFGGHSWFVPREYLKCMADPDLEFRKQYKYVGEDAWLSYYNFVNYDLRTIVPEHYPFDTSFWGSDVQTAITVGTDGNAVSKSTSNLENMYEMVRKIREKGWLNVVDRCENYFYYYYNQYKNLGNNSKLFEDE